MVEDVQGIYIYMCNTLELDMLSIIYFPFSWTEFGRWFVHMKCSTPFARVATAWQRSWLKPCLHLLAPGFQVGNPDEDTWKPVRLKPSEDKTSWFGQSADGLMWPYGSCIWLWFGFGEPLWDTGPLRKLEFVWFCWLWGVFVCACVRKIRFCCPGQNSCHNSRDWRFHVTCERICIF